MIQSISTDIRIDESKDISILAATHGMTKGQMNRALIRYALTHKIQFQRWLRKQYGITDYDWKPR